MEEREGLREGEREGGRERGGRGRERGRKGGRMGREGGWEGRGEREKESTSLLSETVQHMADKPRQLSVVLRQVLMMTSAVEYEIADL